MVSMTSGPERPDAAKGDQKIAGRHGLRIGRHPRRSLSGRAMRTMMIHAGIVATHRGALSGRCGSCFGYRLRPQSRAGRGDVDHL
jgi:hypothetical protein